MPNDHDTRDFPGRRWLTVVLRSLHLVAVIWLGVCLMGFPPGASLRVAHACVTGSGVLIFGLDLWHRPGHLREVSGLNMLAKILLVATMAVVPQHALALYWIIVIQSALVSHAPASFRHARVIGR